MKIEHIKFTEENIQKLFGTEAAEDEDFERLQSYYVKNSTHRKIDSDLPLRILVGHKGIGKSAIFKMIQNEDLKNKKLSILIQPNDVSSIGLFDNDFTKIIRNWKDGLNEIIVKKILENLSAFTPDFEEEMKKMIKLGGKIVNYLYQTFDKIIGSTISCDATQKAVIEKFLKEKKIVVYIDDLDRGWQSTKEDIIRISALLNAVRDMCNENRGLQFRISLRTDVYYLVRTADESTDKIEGNVIWHSWTNHEILVLLVARIESFLGRKPDIEKLKVQTQEVLSGYLLPVFEPHFTGKGKWENTPIHKVLMSLTRKRPRDLVKLCTAAARKAGDENRSLISTLDFQSIFQDYSLGRIQDTVNEYKSELPNIENLLLKMKPSSKDFKEKKGWLYTTDELKNKINNILSQTPLIYTNKKRATKDDILQFLYKINFITARKKLEDGTIQRKYFEENRYLSSSFVDFGYKWEIHPAFRWALNPPSLESVFDDLIDPFI